MVHKLKPETFPPTWRTLSHSAYNLPPFLSPTTNLTPPRLSDHPFPAVRFAVIDALLESINVRDLLSAQDLSDPTTPLSASDLRLLIQRLDSHSLKIKSKIQSYLLSQHRDFADLFSPCNNAVSRSTKISDDVVLLLASLSDRPVEAEIGNIMKQMSATTKEAREKRELLELVRPILEISEKLKAAREAVRNGRLRFAAEEVRELKKALRVCDDDRVDEREPVVYGLLRKEWSDCFDEVN